ncbi:MAG TPA: MBL fold metallo-hydrolase [Solirubrobacteraceae bacterium]|nr:MBL fold metallo-hydrolase [Solirubrobacteraceae bacterium]
MQELAPGLWRWTARHAEWHPGEWGAEVASFAVDAGDAVLLVDPLLPDDDAEVLERLDALGPAAILVTIPYHARSSEALAERYGAPIHGHPAVAKRLRDGSRLEPLDALPGGARAFPIGKPRRHETPIHLPSHRALAFGDAIVTTPEGDLRIWHTDRVDDARARWYRERFVPTLEPLRELDLERILVTHGEPVLHDGSAALEDALTARPWYRHG